MFGDKPLRGVTVLHSGDLADGAYKVADGLIGNKLVTIQTGEEGKIVRRVLIEDGCNIAHEYYCSILLDRGRGQNLIMVSTEGMTRPSIESLRLKRDRISVAEISNRKGISFMRNPRRERGACGRGKTRN